MRKILALSLALAGPVIASAQGVERVIVEPYHVEHLPGGEALTTYRIFIDLAPGYRLQMVYGDERHPLWIRTTTFFNDTVNGAAFADRIDADRLGRHPLALDSWLTLGDASSAHKGIPLRLDTDGSVLECPPYGIPGSVPDAAGSRPLCIADGLVRDTAVKDITPFNLDPACLDKARGAEVATTNGAWAVLGRMDGPVEENILLIAQLSTTGTLSFHLNLQLATPQGMPVKYVADDPAEGEVHCPELSFPGEGDAR